jgi:sugar lactone lactonase YvrE
VDTNTLVDRRSPDDQKAAETVVCEGNKGDASDGLESDATGNIYLTNYEHNAILRYRPDDRREWETIVHDPRLL